MRRTSIAFSLVELLVVLALIMILLAFVIPSLSSVSRASQLGSAASNMLAQLDLARQTALSNNTEVQVRFYYYDGGPGTGAYRAMQLYDPLTEKAMDRVYRLPTGFILMNDDTFSSVLSDENPAGGSDGVAAGLTGLPYKSIRFRPGGGISLPPQTLNGDKWFFTLKAETEPETQGKPAENFITIQIDPRTGRSRSFQP